MKTKQEYFERPKKVQDIVGDKELVYSPRRHLIDNVESLTEDQAIVVRYPIVPGGYGRSPLFEDWQNFLKRGPEVYLQVPETRTEALEYKIAPHVLRKEAFDKLDNKAYSGYVWKGFRSERRKKVHLVDCLEGAKLFSFSENNKDLDDKISHRAYTNGHVDHGGTFTFKVPSRSSDNIYSLRLQSVPLVGSKDQYAVWNDLDSEHGCDLKVNEFSFRRASKEDVFCPHEIAAYLTLAKDEYQNSGKVMLMPFALPTERTVNVWNKLRDNVMIEEKKIIKDKERNVKRPLNKAELEILLWEFVGKYKNDATFFSRRKLKDYEW